MKKFFKILGLILLWSIAAFVLNFVIIAIAIAANDGNPVSGANCSLITTIIIIIIANIVHRRKKKVE